MPLTLEFDKYNNINIEKLNKKTYRLFGTLQSEKEIIDRILLSGGEVIEHVVSIHGHKPKKVRDLVLNNGHYLEITKNGYMYAKLFYSALHN